MSHATLDAASQAVLRQTPPVFRAAAGLLARNWEFGALEFVLPSGQSLRLHGAEPGPEARLSVRHFRFMRRVFASGAIGFAEGYMAGEWDTPDLAQLLEVFSLNFDRLQQLVDGQPLMRLVNGLLHSKRRNTRAGSRRNIHAHYDLGEAFYGAWLDPSMTYSSAVFSSPGASLQAAQEAKYAALARSIDITPDHHVLEIGCGWGGFAEHVAGHVGARYTGITISKAQHEYARKRVFEQGLAERAEILLTDYRDVQGRFDRVASIEMFEAVGEAYWPNYFAKVSDVLTPGGMAGLQIITIKDELFSHYRRNTDFIQKYVFPGGMLPSESRLMQEVDQAGLVWRSAARYGEDYARTLAQWADRFQAAWRAITDLGFDERFRRLWLFYLSYCEAGFRTGRCDVIQVSLSKA
ncbi:MAG TPA: cyclopropane-fatty-acyl-phospholipid synthase family protein [Caulobacteraceae bacterium]|nr:cyclopropane-fatty-acyl-phospholipid synthase family protein [Caulobacteraceae bacterium]